MVSNHPYPAAPPPSPQRPPRQLGLPWWAFPALALLAVPRIFVHDLGIDVGPAGTALLGLGPPALWVFVVLRARVPRPVLTLMVVGALYGVALGLVHNLLWHEVFADSEPTLNGLVDDEAAEIPLRVATLFSSLFTGIMVGVISGVVAAGIRKLGRRSR
ncbi:MAG TPA: hypothetical protein VFO49_16125 [Nocardioides sp.]|nr:hypothetical protein [Nocardioides sp.]